MIDHDIVHVYILYVATSYLFGSLTSCHIVLLMGAVDCRRVHVTI